MKMKYLAGALVLALAVVLAVGLRIIHTQDAVIQQLKDDRFELVFGFGLPHTDQERATARQLVLAQLLQLKTEINEAKKLQTDFEGSVNKLKQLGVTSDFGADETIKAYKLQVVHAQNRYDAAKKQAEEQDLFMGYPGWRQPPD